MKDVGTFLRQHLPQEEQQKKETRHQDDSNSLSRFVHDKAIALLARREHSQKELQRKLSKHCDDPDLVNSQIERLAQDGTQSDQRFCESYVRMKQKQGKGPQWIRHALRDKGISEQISSAQIDLYQYDWKDLAKEVYLKKYGEHPADTLKEKARRQRFMHMRGFCSDTINSLIP
ncbi:MAG: recombination regulator RecX [Alteromonadaceae bacterium]|nr:MAG: recombination regulator RecX [Alteromonadaceae bacterium]